MTIGLLLAAMPIFAPSAGAIAWNFFLLLMLLLLAVDGLRIAQKKNLRVEWKVPKGIPIGRSAEMLLQVEIVSADSERAAGSMIVFGGGHCHDLHGVIDLDVHFEGQSSLKFLRREDGMWAGEVALIPKQRGNLMVERLWLRWSGPFGLVQRSMLLEIQQEVRVTIDIGIVRDRAIRHLAESFSGEKMQRFRGEGSEFESLNPYRTGMDTRHIDWKASARHHELLCRQFKAERNHPIVMAFDCGYLMREPIAGLPKLDHFVHAGLVLSYIALKTGDRVGAFSFNERPRGFIEPHPGTGMMHKLQNFCAGLDYSPVESNYTLALSELLVRLRRRSLVIIFTDFIDSIAAHLLRENLQRLAQKHKILFVTMQDPGFRERCQRIPDSEQSLHEVIVIDEMLRDREMLLKQLRRSGMLAIEAAPGALTSTLMNNFLEIRRKELV